MSILKFEFTYNTENGEFSVANIDTGEIKSVSTKKVSKKKKDESTVPQLILEDNKYSLNSAAIELMQVNPEDKLDIKYEKRGNQMVPVIGTDEVFGTKQGCKLTKSNTVSCRGSRHDELIKYGTEFTVIPHDSKPKLFILDGGINLIEEIQEDKNISLEEDNDLDFIDTLSEENKDAEITEITSDFFKL